MIDVYSQISARQHSLGKIFLKKGTRRTFQGLGGFCELVDQGQLRLGLRSELHPLNALRSPLRVAMLFGATRLVHPTI